MISIAKRVKSAIDHYEKGEVELALTEIFNPANVNEKIGEGLYWTSIVSH